MKNVLLVLIAILLLSMLITTHTSCSITSSVDKSMVQVFSSDKDGHQADLLSFGVAVGDGTQILTVINYENDIPDSLWVGIPGKTKYQASVQVTDPRTSITLLKVKDASFKPIAISSSVSAQINSEIIIHGWVDPDYDKLETQLTAFPGFGKIFMVNVEPGPYIASQGAVVTNNHDEIIGLIGTLYNAFVFRLGGPGMTPPIIDIQSAMAILSPDAVEQPWAKGPVYTLEVSKDSNGSQLFSAPPLEKYGQMTITISSLLDTLGEPLTDAPIRYNFRDYMYGTPEYPLDGKILGIIYPKPLELRNVNDQIVAEAKWVGIQWGRSEGKPNVIYYGHFDQGNALLDGGFLLNGDITELEKTLD